MFAWAETAKEVAYGVICAVRITIDILKEFRYSKREVRSTFVSVPSVHVVRVVSDVGGDETPSLRDDDRPILQRMTNA